MTLPTTSSEIERLKLEIAQERQMKEMLDESLKELQTTVAELEKHSEGQIEEENNEWKTRYENQTELNEQLQKQIILMAQRMDEAKMNIKDNQSNSKATSRGAETQEVTTQTVRQLEKEKEVLESQLRDLEWRLDQESKAYHKANEDRKSYTTDLSTVGGGVEYVVRGRPDGSTRNMGSTGTLNSTDEQRTVKRTPGTKTHTDKTAPKI